MAYRRIRGYFLDAHLPTHPLLGLFQLCLTFYFLHVVSLFTFPIVRFAAKHAQRAD